MNILNINNLSYFTNEKVIIDNLDLSVEKGKIYAVIGNNNCGKTTLIKLISGIIPTTDKIVLNNISLNKKNVSDYIVELGVVLSRFENQFLFDNVYQELSFPLKNLGYGKDDIEYKINKILEEFDFQDYKGKSINELTLSEKQKLLIIIALVHQPKLLVMDDPFSMINNRETAKIFEVLKEKCQNEDLTVLFTTNNLDDTLHADNLIVMDKGKVVLSGEKFDVLKEDQQLLKLGLEIPFMVDLSIKLKFYNLIDEFYLNMEDMVNTLWK